MKAFHDVKELLYLETDASHVGLRGSLLQMRDRMQFARNKASDNAALQPLVFASKSFISTETQYGDIAREALSIFHGLKKFDHYCLTHRVKVIMQYQLLVAYHRCSNEYVMYPAVQHKNMVQIQTTAINSRLAVQTQ